MPVRSDDTLRACSFEAMASTEPVEQAPVSQAEAYRDDTYLVIRNSRTDQTVEFTRQSIDVPLREVPDLGTFLIEVAPLVRGAAVIVALGDSTTANFSNWASILAREYLRGTGALVINLADWSKASEEHIPVLQAFLPWLGALRASEISVVFMGGSVDAAHKLSWYAGFSQKGDPRPVSQVEDELRMHPYGAQTNLLIDDVPPLPELAPHWIACRTLAIVKMIDRLCADNNSRFLAVLQPLSYADCTPQYLRDLRELYRSGGETGVSFEEWRRDHGYSLDTSAFFKLDLHPVLTALGELWRAHARRSPHGTYVDWSRLFHGVDEPCFQANFDAVHYSPSGVRLIARSILKLLAAADR